jgi:hypothetical protein
MGRDCVYVGIYDCMYVYVHVCMLKLSCSGLSRPLGLHEVRFPRISGQSAHEGGKVVSYTHRPPLPPENILATHSSYRLSRHQSHTAARRIKVNEKFQQESNPRPSGL